MPVAATPRQYGDYLLLEPLGRGGMSEVDLARRSVDSAGFVRFVVIKRILRRNNADEAFVRMFMDEARINAELQHENIAQVYDFGERNGEWYLAMEYVPGIDLRRLQKAVSEQKEGGALLPPRVTLRILHDVLAALQYAHNRVDTFGRPMRIVHRDVNPRNIMISVRGEVKLIDFGVAKAENRHDQTTGKTIKGKFAYMAPEQIESQDPVDGRADLFALGLVLQELLTGTHPFRHLSEIQIIHRLVSGRIDPMPPCRLHPDPASVRAVRDQALAMTPSDRFADARSFQEALVRLAAPLGGLASRAELAGFFQRSAPETATQIAERLRSWRDAAVPAASSAPLYVPPDADIHEETWGSDMRTSEVPESESPGRRADATVADSSAEAPPSSTEPTLELDPPAYQVTTAPAAPEAHSGSATLAPSRSMPAKPALLVAMVLGGALGLAAIAAAGLLYLYTTQPTQPPVVPAPPISNASAPVPLEPPVEPELDVDVEAETAPEVKATTETRPAPPKARPAPAPSTTSKTARPSSSPASPPPTPKPKSSPSTAPSTGAEKPPEQASEGAEPAPAPASTPEAAPSEEDAATGFLYITSRPSGMEVIIAGRVEGKTPRPHIELPVGSHTITLRDPATGESVTRTAVVKKSQPTYLQVER